MGTIWSLYSQRTGPEPTFEPFRLPGDGGRRSSLARTCARRSASLARRDRAALRSMSVVRRARSCACAGSPARQPAESGEARERHRPGRGFGDSLQKLDVDRTVTAVHARGHRSPGRSHQRCICRCRRRRTTLPRPRLRCRCRRRRRRHWEISRRIRSDYPRRRPRTRRRRRRHPRRQPAVSVNRTGHPRPRTAIWIFVLRPPRERPSA